MQSGPDTAVLTVPSVIKLSIVMVAVIATGLLLAISIRAILKVLFNGTEYGSWPGLRKWIGRKSIPKTTPFQDALMTEVKALEENLKNLSGVSPFSYGSIGNFGGLKVLTDPSLPKNTMYYMNSKYAIFGQSGWKISQAQPSDSFFDDVMEQTIGICGMYEPATDVICFEKPDHQGKSHKWVSNALIHSILQETDPDFHYEAMIYLRDQVQSGALQVIEIPNEPPHPKLRKTANRTEAQMAITEVLRECLEPIHMEGGETWLEVLDPKFTYDVLAERILQRLEGRER